MKNNRINSDVIRDQLNRKGRGVNLANRHARLLRPNRNGENNLDVNSPSKLNYTKPPQREYFQGFLIPQKPIPPSPDECCMSNCRPCVHDIYLSSLTQFKKDTTYIIIALKRRNIPIHTWPSEIRSQGLEILHPTEIPKNSLSGIESHFDLAEMKAVEAAREARKIMADRANFDGNKGGLAANGKGMLLEASKLVFWVLKGCPG